ncbi:MAG: TetR/AcrR family transcriptional regulator [Bacilli bacterium]|nr:TetR/AcrR family transcriptional regulator [Bacilli bacterium]
MPSQTFLNLDEEKQKKLIDSAIDEFCCHDYANVSINQIIMNASIPRGSFYMYFKDKDDLFEYIVSIHSKNLEKLVINSFEKNEGDLYNSFIYLYEKLADHIIKNKYQGLFKNIFIYFDTHKKHFHKPALPLYLSVKDLIKTDKLRSDEIEFCFVMLLHHTFMTLTYCINNDCLDDKEQFVRKLNILCYGIYK